PTSPSHHDALSLHDALPIYQEWAHLARSGDMVAALEEWAGAEEALRFSTIAELEAIATSWDGTQTNDAVLSSLLARASTDRYAADRKSTRLNSSHGSISYAV